jgi:signal transduction histidine kinase
MIGAYVYAPEIWPRSAAITICKHSGANRVEVAFGAQDSVLWMSVEDDGCGFDPEQAAAGGSHFGLDFMRERAAEVGGRLRVEPASGRGTRVVVEVGW